MVCCGEIITRSSTVPLHCKPSEDIGWMRLIIVISRTTIIDSTDRHGGAMDGEDVAATLMCISIACPVCICPKDELDQTDTAYLLL